jgi:aspartyl protease family protein
VSPQFRAIFLERKSSQGSYFGIGDHDRAIPRFVCVRSGEKQKTMLFWPVMIVGLVILALLLSAPASDVVVVGGYTDMRAVYLAVLLAVLAIMGAGRVLLNAGHKSLVHTAAWLGAIAGLVTAFTFRDEATIIVNEIRSELMPSVALSRTTDEAVLGRGWDGHYLAETEVNGVGLKLLIDTGASMVLIPYEEAAAIGVDLDALDFSVPVTTANGRSAVAPVQLSSVKIGPIAVFDVSAAVAQPGRLKTGLLGMSFLDMLAEASFQGDRLILRQKSQGQENTLQINSIGD